MCLVQPWLGIINECSEWRSTFPGHPLRGLQLIYEAQPKILLLFSTVEGLPRARAFLSFWVFLSLTQFWPALTDCQEQRHTGVGDSLAAFYAGCQIVLCEAVRRTFEPCKYQRFVSSSSVIVFCSATCLSTRYRRIPSSPGIQGRKYREWKDFSDLPSMPLQMRSRSMIRYVSLCFDNKVRSDRRRWIVSWFRRSDGPYQNVDCVRVRYSIVRAGNGAEASVLSGNEHERLPHQNNPRQEVSIHPNAICTSILPYLQIWLVATTFRLHEFARCWSSMWKPSKSGSLQLFPLYPCNMRFRGENLVHTMARMEIDVFHLL